MYYIVSKVILFIETSISFCLSGACIQIRTKFVSLESAQKSRHNDDPKFWRVKKIQKVTIKINEKRLSIQSIPLFTLGSDHCSRTANTYSISPFVRLGISVSVQVCRTTGWKTASLSNALVLFKFFLSFPQRRRLLSQKRLINLTDACCTSHCLQMLAPASLFHRRSRGRIHPETAISLTSADTRNAGHALVGTKTYSQNINCRCNFIRVTRHRVFGYKHVFSRCG